MATRKTAAKKTAKSNQQAAAQRTAAKTPKAAPLPSSPTSDTAQFGTADNETQKAASVQAQQVVSSFTDPVAAQAVDMRVDAVQSALAERDRIVAQEADKAVQADVSEQASVAGVLNDLQAAPKAPVTNAMQKPSEPVDTGIHPDVTSPTNLLPNETPRLPGTGVADPRDLAPGQDMSPSPPVSSSNIVPSPNKPGTLFSKV